MTVLTHHYHLTAIFCTDYITNRFHIYIYLWSTYYNNGWWCEQSIFKFEHIFSLAKILRKGNGARGLFYREKSRGIWIGVSTNRCSRRPERSITGNYPPWQSPSVGHYPATQTLLIRTHIQLIKWAVLIYFVLIWTHLPLDKMATILRTIFSDAFSWMNFFVFWLKFHWCLFLRVQLTISQHWIR